MKETTLKFIRKLAVGEYFYSEKPAKKITTMTRLNRNTAIFLLLTIIMTVIILLLSSCSGRIPIRYMRTAQGCGPHHGQVEFISKGNELQLLIDTGKLITLHCQAEWEKYRCGDSQVEFVYKALGLPSGKVTGLRIYHNGQQWEVSRENICAN